jgi:diguanylate cyclase (GGDEF)-like protein
LADDRPDGEWLMKRLRDMRDREGVQAFSTLLHLLAHLNLPDLKAESLLTELLRHREEVHEALGRDPGLRVATLDYLSNVRRLLGNPTIVEQSQLEATEKSAITDPLTRLFNRRHFMRALDMEVRRSERYSLRMSLLMLDLDEFKALNDRHGHLFGDLVLQRVGKLLRKAVRDADVACRFGGEEFAVILPETDRLGSFAVAERIRRSIRTGFAEKPIGGKLVHVSLSGGIAAYPEDGPAPAKLVARADQALYLAKRGGKNRISLHHSERRGAVRYPAKGAARVELVRRSDAEPVPARPVNLSLGGVLLDTRGKYDTADHVEVRFDGIDATGRKRDWSTEATVIRVEPGEASAGETEDSPQVELRRVALAFARPIPEDCLFQHVRRNRETVRERGMA